MKEDLQSLGPLLDAALEKALTSRSNIPVEEERLALCKGLILHLAYSFSRAFRIPADDLIQEGMLAVIIASRDYDPAKGRFAHYALPRMRGRMIDFAIANLGPVTRDGRAFKNTNFSFCPFDSPAYDDGPSLAEFLPAAEVDAEQPPARFMTKEVCDAIAGALDALPPKHRAVVILKIWGGMTSEAAGEILGMTKGSVHTVFHLALKNMRDAEPLVQATPLRQFDRGHDAGRIRVVHRYDAEFRDQTVKEWFASGMPRDKYAAQIGVPSPTLIAWKAQYLAAHPDAKAPCLRPRYSAEFKLAAVERVLAGESLTNVAREIGTDYNVVSKWKKEHLAFVTSNPQTSLCN
jgi:RNA polymerase sigma factor (sigma-70 family)